MVHLGQELKFKDYWPGAIAPPSAPRKIVALKKGSEFGKTQNVDIDVLKNRLVGDFEFQALPLLRLVDVFKLTGIELLQCESFFRSYRETFESVLQNASVVEVSVPTLYSCDLFRQLNGIIQS